MSGTGTDNSSTQAGKSVGDTVKGLFTGVHGAGESIRGTINDTLDQFGNGIASDGKSTTDEKRLNKLESSGHAQQNHANTVETGKQEMSEGLDAIGGKK